MTLRGILLTVLAACVASVAITVGFGLSSGWAFLVGLVLGNGSVVAYLMAI
jgi:hypothetical protein